MFRRLLATNAHSVAPQFLRAIKKTVVFSQQVNRYNLPDMSFPLSDLQSTLTGQDVIDPCKADIEGFFETGHHFELRVETSDFAPTCKGSGPTARIQLPAEMLEKAVDSFEDLALLLLILGHETAHHLHRHNEPPTSQP